ncbi:MAG: ATP-binding cassette domain-containing protein [Armatimonadetes bacterium]|nr:ATP-binding cassette domain-containing protein [Armatimonadota bacterium]
MASQNPWMQKPARGEPQPSDDGLVVDSATLAVADRVVLRELSLHVPLGETHVIFGPNGAGKTTLLAGLMGMPHVKIVWGDIRWRGASLLGFDITERVRRGLAMAFQRPPAVSGITLRRLTELILSNNGNGNAGAPPPPEEVQQRIFTLAERLDVLDLLDRDVNAGFSGGETKRSEIFQVALQNPQLVLLDEPESGVDVVNMDRIGRMIRSLLQRDERPGNRTVTGLIITHSGYILNYVNADCGHVLADGRIICSGNARDVFEHIHEHGFEACAQCPPCQVAERLRRRRES